MIHRTSLLGVLAAVMLAGGCVSQQQYDQLQAAYRASQEQVVEAQSRLAECQQRLDMIAHSGDEVALLMAERDRLAADLNTWALNYKKLEDAYRELAGRTGEVLLTPEMDRALRNFAKAHGDLVTYDAALGMIKFRSDLTFALGSADVKGSAKATLATLAGLLNDDAAAEYDVKVVGHTDNVPIRRAETRQKHPTNWHLSVHRAIAVRNALQSAGVKGERTSVAGFGEYWPIVTNTPGGAEANRRVEIFLVAARPKDMLTAPEAPAATDPAPDTAEN